MLTGIFAALALVGASDPDGVIETAPENAQSVLIGASAPVAASVPVTSAAQIITPHGLTTDAQIDRWLAERTTEDRPFSDGDTGYGGLLPEDDREIHGEVSASIGTGDFSAYSASVSLPIGENGRVNLSYSQSKNGYYGYPGYGYGPGYGGGYGYADPFYRDRGVVSSVTRRERVFEQRDSQDVLRLGREPITAQD